MCDDCAPPGGWSRRRFLTATGGALVVPVGMGPMRAGHARTGPARASLSAGDQLTVLRRDTWAGDDRPPGPLIDEPDVRFLVVHHTVNDNDYEPDDVAGMLRSIHAFHTGAEKGWPDIAYNFVVDRFGRAWETRAGSLERSVAGDATGGNQGFDQKCAFLGDHTTEPPTAAAVATMAALLAWLADRSGLDTAPGATASFTSRGSNRHPAGTEVVTDPIAGHRGMSYTSCPGDAGFAVVRDELPAAVRARRAGATATTTSAPASPSSSTPPTPTSAPSPAPPPTVPPPPPSDEVAAARGADRGSGDLPLTLPGMAAVGGAAVVLGTVIARRSRRG